MNRKPVQHHMEGLAALLLFGVFAACILGVLLTGADAYRRLTQRDQVAYDRRTCVQYVATRARQGDALGELAVEDFGGVDCLAVTEVIDGADFVTRVYCYEGYLRELFSAEADGLEPEDGEAILAAEGLILSLEDGLLTITVDQAGGGRDTLLLSLRTGEVGS